MGFYREVFGICRGGGLLGVCGEDWWILVRMLGFFFKMDWLFLDGCKRKIWDCGMIGLHGWGRINEVMCD